MGGGASKAQDANAHDVKVNEEALKVAQRQNELLAKQEEQIQKAKQARIQLEKAQQEQREQEQAEAKARQEEKIKEENRIQQEKFNMIQKEQEKEVTVQREEPKPVLNRDEQVDRLLSMTPIKETSSKLQGLENKQAVQAPPVLEKQTAPAVQQATEKKTQQTQIALQLDSKSSEGYLNPSSTPVTESASQMQSQRASRLNEPVSMPHIVDSEMESDAEENKEDGDGENTQQDEKKKRLEVKMALEQQVNRLDKQRLLQSSVDFKTEPDESLKPALANCKVNQVSYTNLGEVQQDIKFDIKPITTKSVAPKNGEFVMNGLVSNRDLELDCEENRNIDMNELKNLLAQC